MDEERLKGIAGTIRRSRKLYGDGWHIDLDEDRIDDQNREVIYENIASCIENGTIRGICPYWQLNVKNI